MQNESVMFRNNFIVFTVLVALIMTGRLDAGIKVVPPPFPPHHTVIGSISADSITIATFDKSKTYKITKYTLITFKGKTATVDDLKPGMKVSVTVNGDGTSVESIRASPAPIDPPATPAANPWPPRDVDVPAGR